MKPQLDYHTETENLYPETEPEPEKKMPAKALFLFYAFVFLLMALFWGKVLDWLIE